MLKNKLKLSICIFAIICLITSICLATDSNNDIATISANSQEAVPTSMEGGDPVETTSPADVRYSDLYVSDKETTISNTIIGNAYASVATLNIAPESQNSSTNTVISGNVFATAATVNIKSDVTYSDETDKDGFQKISSNWWKCFCYCK